MVTSSVVSPAPPRARRSYRESSKVSDESSTAGLTADELVRLLNAADAHSPGVAALVQSWSLRAAASPRPWAPTCVSTTTTGATSSGDLIVVYSTLWLQPLEARDWSHGAEFCISTCRRV